MSARACLLLALGCSSQSIEGDTSATSSNAGTELNRAAGGAKSFTVEAATSRKGAGVAREELVAWGDRIKKVHASKQGCHQVSYPDEEWSEVPCLDVKPLPPMPARLGASPVARLSPAPAVPGSAGSEGIGLQAALDQSVYQMDGSFWLVKNLTSIYGPRAGSSCADISYVNDSFSYQLNSNLFHDPNCVGGMNGPECGWQQFIFQNYVDAGLKGWVAVIFVESWLLGQTHCPSGWTSISDFPTELGMGVCYRNGGVTQVPQQTVADVATTTLEGRVDLNGTHVVLITPSGGFEALSGAMPSFPGQWTQGEFNIRGSACGGSLQMPGAVLGPQVKIIELFPDTSSVAAPIPVNATHTGEGIGMNVLPASLCPQTGVAPSSGQDFSGDQGSVRGLEMSPDAKQPSIPFCLLNDTTGISQPLW